MPPPPLSHWARGRCGRRAARAGRASLARAAKSKGWVAKRFGPDLDPGGPGGWAVCFAISAPLHWFHLMQGPETWICLSLHNLLNCTCFALKIKTLPCAPQARKWYVLSENTWKTGPKGGQGGGLFALPFQPPEGGTALGETVSRQLERSHKLCQQKIAHFGKACEMCFQTW